MQITHVVRAAEHLSNTPVQVLVYEALGDPLPQFAHVPVVNEPKSKKKLSKRDMKKFVTPEVRRQAARRRLDRRADRQPRRPQPGHGGLLPRAGLPAGGAGQLPRPARLVARRQDARSSRSSR